MTQSKNEYVKKKQLWIGIPYDLSLVHLCCDLIYTQVNKKESLKNILDSKEQCFLVTRKQNNILLAPCASKIKYWQAANIAQKVSTDDHIANELHSGM